VPHFAPEGVGLEQGLGQHSAEPHGPAQAGRSRRLGRPPVDQKDAFDQVRPLVREPQRDGPAGRMGYDQRVVDPQAVKNGRDARGLGREGVIRPARMR